MSWRTNRFVTKLRNFGRATGANTFLASLMGGAGYESRFKKMMLASVQKGDCVWDVGANVGYYTTDFAELVGGEGKVFAFEPSPVNMERLKKAVEEHRNVVLVPLALGNREGVVRFQQGDDPLGATSRVLDEPASAPISGRSGIEVRMAKGDDLVSAGTLPVPHVIKMDTEGFELDVLRGLMGVLKAPRLRVLCMEVHFGLLNERGVKDGPRQIEDILSRAGFRCRWPDPSHLMAARILK